MKLWTIQHIDFYKELLTNKKIFANPGYVEKDFEFGYKWMIEQMNKRIGPSKNNSFPLWAWFQHVSSKKNIPDIEMAGLLEEGTNGVLLEIEKDNNSVLLSDYILWHYVFAYKDIIADSEEEAKMFEFQLAFEKLDNKKFEELPIKIQNQIINSWEKIFDMTFDCSYYTYHFRNKPVQATFWELNLSEVIKATPFVAK